MNYTDKTVEKYLPWEHKHCSIRIGFSEDKNETRDKKVENGSQGMATNRGGNTVSTDILYTGPTSVGPVPGAQTPPTPTPVPGSPASPSPQTPRKRQIKKLLLTLGLAIGGMLLIIGAVYAFEAFRPDNNGAQQNDSKQFSNTEVPLDQLVNQDGIDILGTRSLVINGQLRTNDGLVVTPGSTPAKPTEGQIYYDKANKELGYYNGSQFIYVTAPVEKPTVSSLNGTSGDITTGTGLTLVGGALTNTGVLSFQGQTGDVTLSAGTGISVDGDTITNNGDLVVGNEITDVVGGGLLRVGAGTTIDPYGVALQTCANGEVLKSSGGTWGCAADDNSSPTAGNGLQLVGNEFSVNSPTCSGTDKLQWNGTAFICSLDAGGALYSAGTGLTLVGSTFSNAGVLTVTGSGPITSSGGQNPNIAFANGTTSGQFWQWDGSAWVLATLPFGSDTTVGNEVTDVTGVNSGLVRSGAGTAGNPYTLAINAGAGLQLSSGAVSILSATCAGTDKLQWNGTGFICSADIDTDTNTTYGTITNGGIRLSGTNFGLSICATGEVLQAQAVSGEWSCASPTSLGTSYTAGNGLGLTGTQFSVNSPTCAGTDKLQWNGTAFVCSADIDTDTDAQTLTWVDGTRTLSISNGNSVVISDADTTYSTLTNGGLRLVGTEFALGICTDGQILKAQPTSGEWACADDSDTNTTYSAGTGMSLVGNTFNNTGILSITGSGAITATAGQNPTVAFTNGTANGEFWQWNGTAWVLATLPAEVDGVIGNEVTDVTGINSGLSRSGSGTTGSPYTLSVMPCANTEILQSTGSGAWACVSPTGVGTSYNVITNGGIRLVGNNFGLKTCASGELLQAQATSGEWGCANPSGVGISYSAGTGIDITGTTISNTGVISVIGSGPITSTGGANPSIDFASGTTTGEFWQWNGTAWALATLPTESDAVVGNEVTDVTGSNSGLTRSGSGTSGSPYTLAINAGSGLQLSAGTLTIGSPTCLGTTKLQWNGSGFLCSADVDTNTTYSTIANGGLRLSGTNFGLSICATGELLQAQVTSGEWACVAPSSVGVAYTGGDGLTLTGTDFDIDSPTCAGTSKLQWTGTAFVCSADVDTTYSAGTGISLVGTTFSNSGILTLSGSSNFSITGGQSANIAFANGSVNGQVWQWNGTAWVLATLGGAATLQTAYTASTGSTTPEVKLDATRGGLDIQDADTTIGANLLTVRASNGSGLGAALFGVGNTGVATFQNSTDSSAAFKILSAAGGSILNADTLASKISFGVAADFDSMTKLSNPATLPTQRVLGLSWSPDSQYAVAGFAVDSPFMNIYKRSGDTFTKLADPATLPPSHARGSSWSPDGQYMSIAHVSSPYVTIYKRSGDTFTKLANPATLPTGDGFATAWSPDGQYMSVAHTTAPYVTIYKHDGDTFTKLANPANLPAGNAYSTAWSPDGQYMTVAHDTSPFITIYKRSGDTFTKLANPASLPAGGGGSLSMGVSWSPNSTYMAVAHQTTPFITVYKRSGDTFTKLANPATLPDSNGTAVSWAPTGNYLAVAHQAGTSCADVYSLSNDTLTELASPPTSPLGDCRSTAWSPDGRFLLFGNDNSPYFNIYRATNGGPRVDADIHGRMTIEGSTSITQGNLTVDGNISSTSLLSSQTASIAGALDVGGVATFKNSTDSATGFQIQDAAGSGLFTADAVNDRVVIGNATADAVGVTLVLDTKNTSGDPTGVDGAMYYNSNAGKFRCYQAGEWRDCIGDDIMDTYRYTNEFGNTLTNTTGADNTLLSSFTGTGAGAPNAGGEVKHPGISGLNTGTTTTGQAAYMSGIPTGSTSLRLGNSVAWTFRSAVRVNQLSDGTNTFTTRVGFINKADTESTDGCYFRYTHSVNTGKWQGVCRNGSVESVCDTGITVNALAWKTLQIGVATDASVASFVISGVQRCTITTNIPATSGHNTGFGASIIKSAGTTAAQVDLDFFDIRATGTGFASRE